jgi:non-ribosomal peptide synthetase component F
MEFQAYGPQSAEAVIISERAVVPALYGQKCPYGARQPGGRMREFGVPALTEIPASARLTDTVVRRAAAQPDVVVLRRQADEDGWQDVTAAEFGAEVTALASGLMAAGIGPGDRVALMSRTRYRYRVEQGG